MAQVKMVSDEETVERREGAGQPQSAPPALREVREVEIAPPAPVQSELVAAQTAVALKPNRSRRKAGRIALLLLAGLGATIAWYPLSDHHAPYAGGGSITAEVTQISSRVAGPVTQVAITDNAEVKAGDVLFQIDPTPYQLDVQQARAQLEQALNTVRSNIAAIPAAEAKLEQAQVALSTASDDLARAQELAARGLVADAKLSQAVAAQQNSALNVSAATADVDRLRAATGESEDSNPAVLTARAALEKAEFALASATVTAPHDGYVTNLQLTEGQFVGSGTPAMTFINPATQMVIVDLRENQLINVEPGDEAIVTFEAAPGRQFSGTVDSVAWGISSGRASVNGLSQPTTDTRWFPPARKIPVRVKLDDLTDLPANVRLGSEAGVLIVPEDGVIPTIARTLLGFGGFVAGFN